MAGRSSSSSRSRSPRRERSSGRHRRNDSKKRSRSVSRGRNRSRSRSQSRSPKRSPSPRFRRDNRASGGRQSFRKRSESPDRNATRGRVIGKEEDQGNGHRRGSFAGKDRSVDERGREGRYAEDREGREERRRFREARFDGTEDRRRRQELETRNLRRVGGADRDAGGWRPREPERELADRRRDTDRSNWKRRDSFERPGARRPREEFHGRRERGERDNFMDRRGGRAGGRGGTFGGRRSSRNLHSEHDDRMGGEGMAREGWRTRREPSPDSWSHDRFQEEVQQEASPVRKRFVSLREFRLLKEGKAGVAEEGEEGDKGTADGLDDNDENLKETESKTGDRKGLDDEPESMLQEEEE